MPKKANEKENTIAPRSIKSGRKYKKYSRNEIEQALDEYNTTKCSLSDISVKYNITRSVLDRHNNFFMKSHGGQRSLSEDTENDIIDHLNGFCAEWGQPLRPFDLRLFIKGYLDKLGIVIKRFKNNLPGPEFTKMFLKRYTNKLCWNITRKRQRVKSNYLNLRPEVVEKYFENICCDEKILDDEYSSRIEMGNEQVLDDEDSNLSVKFSSEIWEQFEQEGSLSCCNICRMTTENTVEDMKNHLEEKHPGILIEIIKKKTDRADGESADEEMIEEDAVDEEAFTEVVYLEEEPKRKIKNLVCKEGPRRKPKNPLKPTCSFVTLEPASSMKEKPRIEEYKFIPRTTTSVNMEEKQEIDSFLNYASVLLKNVSKESIPKLQLDIIGLIINAQIAHTNQSIPVPSLIHCTASNTDSTDEEIVQEETEAFTDDVYLEDELNIKSKNPFKRPRTGNLAPEPTVQEKPRVEYKTEHSKQEIDSFINYASVLLKNVLRESFPKLQLDIIALIMNAQISRILKPVPPIPSTMVTTGPNHAVTVR